MAVIELPDDQAALKAKSAAPSLKEEASARLGGVQSAANIVLEEMRKVPADLMQALPKNGAHEHDHYLYGWPKKEA